MCFHRAVSSTFLLVVLVGLQAAANDANNGDIGPLHSPVSSCLAWVCRLADCLCTLCTVSRWKSGLPGLHRQ